MLPRQTELQPPTLDSKIGLPDAAGLGPTTVPPLPAAGGWPLSGAQLQVLVKTVGRWFEREDLRVLHRLHVQDVTGKTYEDLVTNNATFATEISQYVSALNNLG